MDVLEPIVRLLVSDKDDPKIAPDVENVPDVEIVPAPESVSWFRIFKSNFIKLGRMDINTSNRSKN